MITGPEGKDVNFLVVGCDGNELIVWRELDILKPVLHRLFSICFKLPVVFHVVDSEASAAEPDCAILAIYIHIDAPGLSGRLELFCSRV